MKDKKFRWHYFIDKPFQLRFIARFAILILLGLAISIGLLLFYNVTRYQDSIYVKTIKDPVKMEAIQNDTRLNTDQKILALIDFGKTLNIYQLLMLPIIYVSILYLVLITIFGLFISHKLAGPVYRIKRTLQDAASGNTDLKSLTFKLRKGDELKDLVDSLNSFLSKVYKK